MRVSPFELSACPRVARAHAQSTRAALVAAAALEGPREVRLPPFGHATLSFIGFGEAHDPPRADHDVELAIGSALSPASDRGSLLVDSGFAARLVDLALGGRGTFSTLRRLGPGERGVLAGLLGPALDHLGWALTLSPVARDRADAEVGVVLVLRVETPAVAGELRARVPLSGLFLRAPPPSLSLERAARLPVRARLVLAATELGGGEVGALSPGDAVVFERVPMAHFGEEASWPAHLVVGEYAISTSVHRDGNVVVSGTFFRAGAEAGFARVTPGPVVLSQIKEDEQMSSSSARRGEEAAAVVASAPVEVTAELGRVTLRGEEVLGLAPGAVLALGASRRRIVLRAAGEPWAEGELVDVDGELGVRITRLLFR